MAAGLTECGLMFIFNSEWLKLPETFWASDTDEDINCLTCLATKKWT
jgi:hypothetical protein